MKERKERKMVVRGVGGEENEQGFRTELIITAPCIDEEQNTNTHSDNVTEEAESVFYQISVAPEAY
jgi:hypothetical protein